MSVPQFDEVYARPGERNIIDAIHPATGRSLYGDLTEEAMIAQHPDAVRMSFEAWQASVSLLQRTPITWTETTEEDYRDMLEVLPPAFWQRGVFLVGEPTDHDVQTGAPRFAAYRQICDSYTYASRPMTIAEARELVQGVR